VSLDSVLSASGMTLCWKPKPKHTGYIQK